MDLAYLHRAVGAADGHRPAAERRYDGFYSQDSMPVQCSRHCAISPNPAGKLFRAATLSRLASPPAQRDFASRHIPEALVEPSTRPSLLRSTGKAAIRRMDLASVNLYSTRVRPPRTAKAIIQDRCCSPVRCVYAASSTPMTYMQVLFWRNRHHRHS